MTEKEIIDELVEVARLAQKLLWQAGIRGHPVQQKLRIAIRNAEKK